MNIETRKEEHQIINNLINEIKSLDFKAGILMIITSLFTIFSYKSIEILKDIKIKEMVYSDLSIIYLVYKICLITFISLNVLALLMFLISLLISARHRNKNSLSNYKNILKINTFNIDCEIDNLIDNDEDLILQIKTKALIIKRKNYWLGLGIMMFVLMFIVGIGLGVLSYMNVVM